MNRTITINIPALPLPTTTAAVLGGALTDWTAIGVSKTEAQDLEHPLQLAKSLDAANIPFRWRCSSKLCTDLSPTKNEHDAPFYVWPEQPKILALIPHWRCERWLRRCLSSLQQQTYSLCHTVVIDDASAQPPLEIVKTFPQVTLLVSPQRVGPYRLIQSVIDATDYDAYLFQDADDWSSEDRLATVLQTARQYGAELVGCQEIRVLESGAGDSALQAVGYPLDVNQALSKAPGHALLHPTSLVTRHLVQRLEGFATGLKFGGDTEFLLRAHWVARVVNSPRYCYFRRKRPDSLTTATATGLDSAARQRLTQTMKERAIANHQAAACDRPLKLKPLKVSPPIALNHICGPSLRRKQA
ncbi:MAG: glycosyltransferase family A protein [Thermosynechococcaceae cyanobacterium]